MIKNSYLIVAALFFFPFIGHGFRPRVRGFLGLRWGISFGIIFTEHPEFKIAPVYKYPIIIENWNYVGPAEFSLEF